VTGTSESGASAIHRRSEENCDEHDILRERERRRAPSPAWLMVTECARRSTAFGGKDEARVYE